MTYPPQYGQQHARERLHYPRQPYHSPQPIENPAPARGAPRWLWAALGATIVFALSGGWYFYEHVIRADPGIAACQSMTSDQQIAGWQKSGVDRTLTQAQYRTMRKVFEDSHYDDIRDHGTKLIDIIWQVSRLSKDNGTMALSYVVPLMEQLLGLQSACADQGIIINLPTK